MTKTILWMLDVEMWVEATAYDRKGQRDKKYIHFLFCLHVMGNNMLTLSRRERKILRKEKPNNYKSTCIYGFHTIPSDISYCFENSSIFKYLYSN